MPVDESTGNWIQPFPQYSNHDRQCLKELANYYWDPDQLIGQTLHVAIDPGNKVTGVNYFIQEDNMNVADMQLANALAERKEKAELEKKLKLVEEYGEDTFENGTILKFSKIYDMNGTLYNYAVLKTNGQWYSTGQLLGFLRGDWDHLVLALVGGNFSVHAEDIIVINATGGAIMFTDRDTSEDTNVITTRSTVVE